MCLQIFSRQEGRENIKQYLKRKVLLPNVTKNYIKIKIIIYLCIIAKAAKR
jgi:hypothetical protein